MNDQDTRPADTREFDVDDAEHVALRDEIAKLIGEKSGEHLHPDKGRRLDA